MQIKLRLWTTLQEAGYEGTLEDYVHVNHENQKKTLENYGINLDFFGASALGENRFDSQTGIIESVPYFIQKWIY